VWQRQLSLWWRSHALHGAAFSGGNQEKLQTAIDQEHAAEKA
jgi:hypothetical protein